MTKRELLNDFIDSMSDDELYGLWNECANEGKVDYIESTDSIDEVFTASKILEMDIEDFNIRDDYYICDGYTLESYGWVRDAIDALDGWDDLIDWILEHEYDGYIDGLIELVESDEYKEADNE